MSQVTVDITNLGGIDSLDVSLPPGVSLLSGENASNRTSFLQSVAAALGGDRSAATLKSDADEGSVSLTIGDVEGTRTYRRTPGGISRSGDPVTDAAELVDTYVSIFADNPARQAVRNGGDTLRDILMRGVDTAEINANIHQLKHRRSAIEDQLNEVESAKSRLPSLEERRSNLETELASIESEIESVEADIDDYDASNEDVEAAERHLDELESLRDRLQRTQSEIDVTESTIAEAEAEKASIEGELESLDVPEADRSTLEARRRELEDEIAARKRAITDLNDIISNNRNLLDGGDVLEEFGTDDGNPTAALDPTSSTVRCWTCGTEVDRATIEGRIETLTDVRNEKNEALKSLTDELETVESSLESIDSKRAKRDRLERDLDDVTETLAAERETLEQLEADADDLRAEIREAEASVEEMSELRNSELADLYQRMSRLNHERGQVETQLSSVESEIEDVRDTVDQEASLRTERETIEDDLEEMRNRIDDVERAVVEAFNEQMDDLVDRLDYDNISRVWIERVGADGDTSSFDLHVVRETVDGSVYEDALETLSESEREIIGIVVALSGYLVHDLDETVPVVLFDSVEAIDANRLQALFEYVNDYAPTIITALLPEEAAAIDQPTVEEPFA
jgi:septal ring factor EnvC (AmiA/AmiB activator)